ncbi:MAG: ScyD/ScyE family protein [Actinomycetes bacterium]
MSYVPKPAPRLVALVAGVVAAAMTAMAPPAAAASSTTLVDGLDGPRGLGVGPHGRIVVGQGDGTIGYVKDGALVKLGKVPASFIAPAVSVGHDSKVYVLTAGGPPGSGAATLYRLRENGTTVTLADIAAYQATDPDPFNVDSEPPEESNPFGVAALPDGSVLVSDAAANDLLRVWPDGEIVTVARIKPRVVAVPEELPDKDPATGEPLPPAGTMIPSEGVATSVTVGADGYYYVGELRGFPATPGTSQVWRIAPDSVNALCDPAAPAAGACQRYADGFTSIVDLAAGDDGSIYVVELVQQSWLQWEFELVDPPLGGLFRIAPEKAVSELLAGKLILPGGTELNRNGKPLATGPVFGPGAVQRVNG